MKETQRRVEMKQNGDGKQGVSKRHRAPRKKPAAPRVVPPEPSVAPIAPPENGAVNEELVAGHELDILLDRFDTISPPALTGAQEPSSHGDDPAATEELWRRLSNTAWLRAPESNTDDGNSSTVTIRP